MYVLIKGGRKIIEWNEVATIYENHNMTIEWNEEATFDENHKIAIFSYSYS